MYDEALEGFERSCNNTELRRQVFQMLPSLSHACRLCEVFLEHGEYMYVY